MSGNELTRLKNDAKRTADANLLQCPVCQGELQARDGVLRCVPGGHSFPLVDGIPCFSEPDKFYDEYASVHCPFAASPHGLKRMILEFLPFWSWREWKFWDRFIPHCDRLLDLGCGRGREVFLNRAKETVGYDGSLTFLRECPYTAVALGQLPRLPFRSSAFDVVTSSHMMGHVSLADKDILIAEIARVLRPGGLTVHIIETDSEHPAVVAAKRNPEAYRRMFIQQHGHIGLEQVRPVLRRFERHGLRLKNVRLVDAIVPSVMNFRVFFDIPEYRAMPQVRLPSTLSRMTAAAGIFNAAYEVGMGAFHRTIEQWFGKPEFAQFIHTVFERAE